ncbi:hypothetical protein EXQ42_04315 [Clostridium botulinum]|uniref:WbqC family protein n=1 Tax=Clostridium botulinum TaxID=1491 RepID=UPI001A922C97|nr:WbqC family protein [Clostridium botulinum]MBO0523282.1 hypothetical protein [Clostridium botulinum]MBO0536996.1 hypothetical protein [Clostridium botulinum]MBO0547323.1 hypothetical protein [Clostridium botulinum]MBO0555453.1 hypothetical protein [Clostridium botulinum]MBO0560020.1 hypothetical protein [Clostridium botulinum]
MILTAHQPVYLPWLGLFHKIALSDVYCFFDDVQYLRRDWNNRNKIKTSNGDIWLTVPVLSKGHMEKSIKDIEINNTIDWRKKHWRAIYTSYKKAPYFSKYADFFEELYKKEWYYLVELNEYMLKFFLDQLGINIKFIRQSELNFKGYKSDLVLDMCKKLEANAYIFGELGKNYADIKSFEREGIKLYFQEYNHPIYKQLWGEFISHISIIDLLFNVGSERALDIIMQGNVTQKELMNLLLK